MTRFAKVDKATRKVVEILQAEAKPKLGPGEERGISVVQVGDDVVIGGTVDASEDSADVNTGTPPTTVP